MVSGATKWTSDDEEALQRYLNLPQTLAEGRFHSKMSIWSKLGRQNIVTDDMSDEEQDIIIERALTGYLEVSQQRYDRWVLSGSDPKKRNSYLDTGMWCDETGQIYSKPPTERQMSMHKIVKIL